MCGDDGIVQPVLWWASVPPGENMGAAWERATEAGPRWAMSGGNDAGPVSLRGAMCQREEYYTRRWWPWGRREELDLDAGDGGSPLEQACLLSGRWRLDQHSYSRLVATHSSWKFELRVRAESLWEIENAVERANSDS